MTADEIKARIRWLTEMLKLLQQSKPKPTKDTRH
jgi:hypothetical protein